MGCKECCNSLVRMGLWGGESRPVVATVLSDSVKWSALNYSIVSSPVGGLLGGRPTSLRISLPAAVLQGGLNKLSYEESKFLGGDIAHTHLVKGLDFALLQKVECLPYSCGFVSGKCNV